MTVSCSTPGHDSHSVSLCGFVLLEEAEGTFGSAEQRVVRIVNHDLKDPFLTALSSRLVRQEEEMHLSLEVRQVECRNVSHARALFTLLKKCQILAQNGGSVQVRVLGSIGAEGWFQLAEAFKLVRLPTPLPTIVLRTLQPVLQEARREDLRTIWDLPLYYSWHVVSRRTGPILIIKDQQLKTKEEEE